MPQSGQVISGTRIERLRRPNQIELEVDMAEELMATTVWLDYDGEAIRPRRPTSSGDLGTRDWRGEKRTRVWRSADQGAAQVPRLAGQGAAWCSADAARLKCSADRTRRCAKPVFRQRKNPY